MTEQTQEILRKPIQPEAVLEIPVQPPKKNNLPKAVLFVVLGLLVVAGAVYGGMKLQEKKSQTPSSQITPPVSQNIPTTIPTEDLMADWKTYTNTTLGFELKYPPEVKVDKEFNDQYNRATIFKGANLHFEVMLRNKNGISLDNYYYMDSPIVRKTILAGLPANVYEFPKGYCDGPSCSDPSISIVTEKDSDLYHFSFFGDTQLSETENQVLSTFKFLDAVAQDNDPLTVAKAYLDAYMSKDWQKAAELCSDVNFDSKIAEGYNLTRYEIVNSKADSNLNNYHVYIRLFDNQGKRFEKVLGNPLEVLMIKDESGKWKAMTWYFFQ